MYVEITAVGPYETARIALQPDGTILLFSSIMPVGQGSETTQRQLVAEELGIAIEQVAIRQGDTDEVPDAVGTFASRGAAAGGAAGRMAARELVKKILNCFTAALDCDPAALRWEGGGAMISEPAEEFIPLAEIPARLASLRGDHKQETIEVKHRIEIPRPSYSYATHIAVVEIDPETGQSQDSALRRRARLRKDREPTLGRRANRRRGGSGHWRSLARKCGLRFRRTSANAGNDGLRFARRVRCSRGFQTLAHGNTHEFQSVWDARRRRRRKHRRACCGGECRGRCPSRLRRCSGWLGALHADLDSGGPQQTSHAPLR